MASKVPTSPTQLLHDIIYLPSQSQVKSEVASNRTGAARDYFTISLFPTNKREMDVSRPGSHSVLSPYKHVYFGNAGLRNNFASGQSQETSAEQRKKSIDTDSYNFE